MTQKNKNKQTCGVLLSAEGTLIKVSRKWKALSKNSLGISFFNYTITAHEKLSLQSISLFLLSRLVQNGSSTTRKLNFHTRKTRETGTGSFKVTWNERQDSRAITEWTFFVRSTISMYGIYELENNVRCFRWMFRWRCSPVQAPSIVEK